MNKGWWALLGVFVGAISSGPVNILLQCCQFAHEKEMHILRNRGAEKVRELLLELLSHKSYTDRSFEAIRNRTGGYSDAEIRQFLHEIDSKKPLETKVLKSGISRHVPKKEY